MTKYPQDKKPKTPRPALRLTPAILPSLLAIAGGALVLYWAWLTSKQDGIWAMVFVIPALFVMLQPVGGFVSGQQNQLRAGTRRHDLKGLRKTVVYNRKTIGYTHSLVALIWADRVEEVSGAFLTSRDFTRLVDWLGPRPEVLEGLWPPRKIASQRPDLVLRRPKK